MRGFARRHTSNDSPEGLFRCEPRTITTHLLGAPKNVLVVERLRSRTPRRGDREAADVRLWHLADIAIALPNGVGQERPFMAEARIEGRLSAGALSTVGSL